MLPLLALFGLPLVPSADLDHFPDYNQARTQISLCNEHLDRLRVLSHHRGWEGGRWEAALAETRFRLTCWQWLALAHEASTETTVRQALSGLKEHVGPARYLQGWSPPLIPEAERFVPLWPVSPAAAESRAPSGVNTR